MTVYYLGQFPPPYGGVTVKNRLLRDGLAERIPVATLSFREDGIARILKTVLLGQSGDRFIIGFGNKDLRRRFIKLLAVVRPAVLSRIVLIGMGGRLGDELRADRFYAQCCSRLRALCLETEGMVAQAREAAIANVVLLPNCRPRPSQLVFPRFRNIDDPLRAVFFSRISKEKGADIVLDAAERMPSVEFDLYGSVDQEYAEIFSHRVSQLSNVHYGGVLDGAVVDVLGELSRYDVHLFPSRWPYEGVPGVLVETKIAAVPSIVSDICYNAEIVADGQSGIVLKHNDADGLCEALLAIEDDVDYLNRLKAGAAESASPYYADACIDAIVALLDKE